MHALEKLLTEQVAVHKNEMPTAAVKFNVFLWSGDEKKERKCVLVNKDNYTLDLHKKLPLIDSIMTS